MAVALWSAHREITGTSDGLRRLVEKRAEVLWIAAAALFVGLSLVGSEAYKDGGSMFLHYGRALFALCILLPAIWGVAGHGPVRRFLGNRWLMAVGVVSYSFYLFHKMVLDQVVDSWPDRINGTAADIGIALTALAGALVLSMLVYLVVEYPAMQLRRLIPDRTRSAGPQQPLAAHGGGDK